MSEKEEEEEQQTSAWNISTSSFSLNQNLCLNLDDRQKKNLDSLNLKYTLNDRYYDWGILSALDTAGPSISLEFQQKMWQKEEEERTGKRWKHFNF